jgi:hypothetical protein
MPNEPPGGLSKDLDPNSWWSVTKESRRIFAVSGLLERHGRYPPELERRDVFNIPDIQVRKQYIYLSGMCEITYVADLNRRLKQAQKDIGSYTRRAQKSDCPCSKL